MQCLIQTSINQPSQAINVQSLSPLQPADNEVVVTMLLSPIHNHNLMLLQGNYGHKPSLPAHTGTEAVGIISKIGKDVQNVSVGQRIITTGNFGTWADEFIAPAEQVMPIPDNLPNEVAAQVLAMPLSAWMVLNKFKPQKDQWLMFNAAAGAVGKNLMILAKSRGIKIIALIHKESLRASLEKLGTHLIINTTEEGWKNQIKSHLGQESILYGVDSIGGTIAGEMLSLMGQYSQLLSFGALNDEPLILDYRDLMFKEASVTGFWAEQEIKRLSDTEKAEMMNELMHLITTQQLQLPVHKIFSLEEYSQAFAEHDQSSSHGKILFKGSCAS